MRLRPSLLNVVFSLYLQCGRGLEVSERKTLKNPWNKSLTNEAELQRVLGITTRVRLSPVNNNLTVTNFSSAAPNVPAARQIMKRVVFPPREGEILNTNQW